MVLKYKATKDSRTGEKVLDIFSPFLNKYFRLLREGMFHKNDYDAKRFLALFKNEEAAPLKGPASIIYYRNTAQYLMRFTLAFSDEELLQQLKLLFLEALNRWEKRTKPKETYFTGFIYNYYRFKVKNWLSKFSKEKLNRPEELANYDVDLYGTEEVWGPEIDLNWVKGKSCGDIFKDLTKEERMIIRMSFIERLTDVEISKRLSIHRNNIHKYKKEAIRKIDTALKDGA